MLKRFRLKAEPKVSKLQYVMGTPRWGHLQQTKISDAGRRTMLRGGEGTWRSGLPNIEHDNWRSLIADYSHRALSRREDKLRAVSGLAKVVQDTLRDESGGSDEYFAGLWRQEFVFDLAWQASPDHKSQIFQPRELNRKRADVGTPTWTWASVDSPVTYTFSGPLRSWKHKPQIQEMCSVVDIRCVREVPDDSTSAVTSGYAVLHGALIPAELVMDESLQSSGFMTSVKRYLRIGSSYDPDYMEESKSGTQGEKLTKVKAYLDLLGELKLHIRTKEASHWNKNRKAKLYCFRMFSWYAYSGSIQMSASGGWENKYMGPETWFLILKESTKTEGAFERIGIGVWDSWQSLRGPCPLFEEAEDATVTIV